ncbi:unnamed protein product [Euphydryas editha]|uniref:Retrovirus-related Pol polyprotein from transposon TNT 1-94 n=1 Tax=Euphydryas editha TaxID=104508 RepID=A0AAU9V2Q0_EUPED|nr:unnamed protein product [Euphydryas editha]
MSASYSINVPKLRGRENYDDWAFAVENYMILEGVGLNDAITLTDMEDKKARAKIIMTIDPSLYTHIKNEKTVRDLWGKLKSLFDDSGFTRKISLLRSLISIRLETSDSMTSYVNQLVETAQKLKGTGFEIQDEWIGSLLLAGLPEKFSPMIMAIEHSGIKISSDAIKTKLLDMSSDFIEVNSEGAFITKPKRGKMHSKTSNNETQLSVSNVNDTFKNKKKVIRCYKCKKVGHYKNQCNTQNEKTNAFSAVFMSSEFNRNDWYVDSGASCHLVANENMLSNITYKPIIKDIIVANQTSVRVKCSGDLNLTTFVKGTEYDIKVDNVLCIPNLTTNLLSVSRIVEKGNRVSFNKHGCYIYNAQNDCIGEACLENNMYRLNIVKSKLILAAAVQTSSTTWHRRLGHINSNDLEKMRHGAVEGVIYQDKCDISKMSCVVCCEGKQARLPFLNSSSKTNSVLELVHADLCGPMENKSLAKSRYYLLFVDDYSRMCFVYFLKTKDETFKFFKEFKELVENQKSTKIKILRSDNGGEFCSAEMENYLKENGIVHQKSTAYSPEQNGLCERYNRSIVEKARCLLFDAQFDKQLWAEAVNTAVYLKNRSPVASLDKNTTPYEMWTGSKPNLSHLRVFGSPVMVHVPKERRKKWDKKAQKMYLVGYPDNVKGFRLYHSESRKITISRDVVVMEDIKNESNMTNILVEEKQPMKSTERLSSLDETEQTQKIVDSTYVASGSSRDSDEVFEPLTTDDMEVVSQKDIVNQPEKRIRRKPDRYNYSNMCVEDMTSEPITVSEALDGPEKEQWTKAMKEELQSFSDNDTWELVDRPSVGTVVKNKWVFKKKFNSDGEVRFRARLVAKGFTQVKGVDFNETYSPVLRYSTLRLLFALSVNLDLNMNHLDVPTAFLNGYINECVFMELPENSEHINNCKSKVLKLKRAIYGLKQSARAWYVRVEESLLKLGYNKSKYEPCLFMKCHNNVKVYVALFVDDFFVFYNCKTTYQELKIVLESEYKIKDLGRIKQCLGMNVNVSKNCITLDQEKFIDNVLARFNMTNCNTSDTPMETNLKLEKSIDNQCDEKFPYQQLVGSLMYLSVLTRPDISFSISFLSQFNTCYNETHWKHLKRLLRYLKKTKKYGLVYRKDDTNLHGFVDADWASCTIDRRSYTGYSFILAGCVISYESKKQRTVALSSTEAEYMALSEACKEAIYLKNLMYEMCELDSKIPLCLYSDNQSCIKLTANPLFHKRTKHIDIRHHFIRECIKNNKINVEYISSSNMPADILTKSLCTSKHYKFLKLLGISEI